MRLCKHCNSVANVHRVRMMRETLARTRGGRDVVGRHYDTEMTSWPGRGAARGQDCDVSCPTDSGLLASRGLVPTGWRGAGGGSDAGEASEDSADSPPGLDAEFSGVSASPSLDASDISSSFTSSSEQGDCGVTIGSGTVPDAAARASM